MTVIKPPDRIAVTGSVNVGDLMNLEQRAEHKLPTASRFSLGRPAGMPAFEFRKAARRRANSRCSASNTR